MVRQPQDASRREAPNLLAIQIATASILLLLGAVAVIVQHGQARRLDTRLSELQHRLDLLERSVLAPQPEALGGTVPSVEALEEDARESLTLRVRALAAGVDARFSVPSADGAAALLAEIAARGTTPSDIHADAALDVASLFLATERPERAIAWSESAEAAGADAGKARTCRAAAFMQMGRPGKAYEAIKAAADTAEPGAAALLLRGQIELALGKQVEAHLTLARAARFDVVAADAAVYLVPSALERGEVDRAAALLERAELLAPRRYDLARLRAEVLLAQGRYERCIELASMLAAVDGSDAAMLWVLGRAQLGATRATAAIATFETLVSRAPEDARAHQYLGLSLLAELEPASAAERFVRAANLAPDSVEAWYYLGVARSNADDCSAAVEALDRAIALEPAHAHARFARAVCMARLGDDEEAQRALERALSLDAALIDKAGEVQAFERILASTGSAG